MTEPASDVEIRQKGMAILFKSLGEVDAVRFLSQVAYEKRDYVKLQDELFAGMTVEDIYKPAKEDAERKGSKTIMPKEKKRLCPECRGAIKQGQSEMVFDLTDITVTVKNVVADVCSKCGQSFITGRVAEEVNRLVNRVCEDVSGFTKTQHEISRRHKKVAIAV